VRRPRLAWAISATFALGLLLGAGAVASDAPAITGVVSATEQESDEGYFAIGSETMIVAKPNSPLHRWLRERTGQQVRVTITTGAASNTE
jgi:hypothetical protein